MDVLQIAFDKAAFGNPWTPGVAFAAGIATSFGPCVAPRFLAISSLVGEASDRRRRLLIAAFCSGLAAADMTIALGASVVFALTRYATLVYALLALGLLFSGVRSLLGDDDHACAHPHHASGSSLGGAFVIGCSFALVISPCCTPIVTSLAMLASSSHQPVFTALVLMSFIAGHALPLVAAGCGAKKFTAWCQRLPIVAPVKLVSGALMVAMAGYYAVLA